MFGISFGAESDIMAYAVVRYFGMDNYSTVLGLLTSAAAGAMTVGAILLSIVLARTDSYSPFMVIAGISTLLGATNLLRLRKIAPPALDMAHTTAANPQQAAA
jgi:hypothetical protein